MPNSQQRTVQATPEFRENLKRLSKKYRRIRSDLSSLLEQLQAGESPGDRIPGTGHVVYKTRVANRDARRGKRGGYRVIYQLKEEELVLLLLIYSKSDQEDVSPDVIVSIIEDN